MLISAKINMLLPSMRMDTTKVIIARLHHTSVSTKRIAMGQLAAALMANIHSYICSPCSPVYVWMGIKSPTASVLRQANIDSTKVDSSVLIMTIKEYLKFHSMLQWFWMKANIHEM